MSAMNWQMTVGQS